MKGKFGTTGGTSPAPPVAVVPGDGDGRRLRRSSAPFGGAGRNRTGARSGRLALLQR
jgi:hypothetical protein